MELIARSDDPAAVEELRMLIASNPQSASLTDAQIDEAVASMTTPWWRVFAGFVPAEHLSAIEVPTFAAWGSLDTQVAAEPNLAAMEEVVAGDLLTAKVYDGLNHLFQPASTGSPQEYATIETTFSEAVMADIAAFVRSPG